MGDDASCSTCKVALVASLLFKCLDCKSEVCVNCSLMKNFKCLPSLCGKFKEEGEKTLCDLKERVGNIEERARTEFDLIRYEIDLSTESLIILLNKHRDALLDNLNRLESEQLDVYRNSSELNEIKSNLEAGCEVKDSLQKRLDRFLMDNYRRVSFLEPVEKLTSDFIGEIVQKESLVYEYAIEKLKLNGRFSIKYPEFRRSNESFSALTPTTDQIVHVIGTVREGYQILVYDKQRVATSTLEKREKSKIAGICVSDTRIYLMHVGVKQVDVYDLELHLMQSLLLSYSPFKLFISNANLYIEEILSIQTPVIHVLDAESLAETTSIGQSSDHKTPYYLTSDDIEISSDKIFMLSHANFTIISMQTGLVLNTFNLRNSVFYFKAMPRNLNKIIFSNSVTRQFEIYDYDGHLVETIDTKCKKLRNFYSFSVNENFEVVFDDFYNKILYTN